MIPDTWEQQVSTAVDYMLRSLHTFREQATNPEAVFTPLTWAVILALCVQLRSNFTDSDAFRGNASQPLVWPLFVTTATALLTEEK